MSVTIICGDEAGCGHFVCLSACLPVFLSVSVFILHEHQDSYVCELVFADNTHRMVDNLGVRRISNLDGSSQENGA